MTERQISQLSESDALRRGVWILWIMICQPGRMYSQADIREWLKKIGQEKEDKRLGKGKK